MGYSIFARIVCLSFMSLSQGLHIITVKLDTDLILTNTLYSAPHKTVTYVVGVEGCEY